MPRTDAWSATQQLQSATVAERASLPQSHHPLLSARGIEGNMPFGRYRLVVVDLTVCVCVCVWTGDSDAVESNDKRIDESERHQAVVNWRRACTPARLVRG